MGWMMVSGTELSSLVVWGDVNWKNLLWSFTLVISLVIH